MNLNYLMPMTLSFGLICCVTLSARAQDNDPEEAQAKAAFAEGTDLFRSEQYKAAAIAFHEAYRLKPSWKILFNMGQCHAAAKEYGLALESFQAYLSEGGDDIPSEKKADVINEVRTLRELVGYVEILGESNLVVYSDENKRGETPLPGPFAVSAGVTHTLRLEKAGAIVFERTVRVNSGNTLKVEVPSSDAASTHSGKHNAARDASVPDQSPKNNTKRLSVIGLTLGGAGVAALAAALGTGIGALSINNSLSEKKCTENSCTDEVTRIDHLETATNVLLGVGGTFAITGAALLIVSAVKKKKAKKAVSIFPTVSTTNAGMAIGCRF